MRMSPKMSEKPAESRNSRPPKAMLFTASVSQRLIVLLPTRRPRKSYSLRLLEIFRRRIVSRIDRVRKKRLLVVGPELTDAGIGFDHRVDELAALALAAADEDVADDVAVLVELDRPARRIGQRHFVQGGGERLPVVGLVAERLDRGLDALTGYLHARRITAGEREVVLLHRLDKALVARRVGFRRIPGRRDHADGFVA